MRTYKFRGKSLLLDFQGTTFVYGSLVMENKIPFIKEFNKAIGVVDYHQVIKETVGQFTGLQDKNGKDIYEGDILRNESGDTIKCVFEIKDSHSAFSLIDEKNPRRMYFSIHISFKIIGNIHEVEE